MKKNISYIIVILLLNNCCNSVVKNTPYVTNQQCDSTYLSRKIHNLVENFKPTNLNLNQTLNEDFVQFIHDQDLVCLRKNKDYNYLIVGILLKLSSYHFDEARQSFDLNSMIDDNTQMIIEDFRSKYFDKLSTKEFFSSYSVWNALERDTCLLKEKYLVKIFDDVKSNKKKYLKRN